MSSVPDEGNALPSGVMVSMLTRVWIAIPEAFATDPTVSEPFSTAMIPVGKSKFSNGTPSAIASCTETRSTPVTSSVTVCST